MFLFELKRYFKMKYKRCISVLIGISFISIYSLVSVNELFSSNVAQINLHSYVIGEFNIIQFVMFLAFPFLFSTLTSDLILDDFNSGYINFIFPRVRSRFVYLVYKLFIIMSIAVLFTISILFSKYLAAIITNMPINGGLQIYISKILNDGSIFKIYCYTIVYFISGLTLIGMLGIFLSMIIKNSGIPVGVVILLGFLHNILYIIQSKYLILLPYSQYILGLQDEFDVFEFINFNSTLKISFIYMWSLIIILFILTLNIMKKYEIRRIS